MSEIAGDLGTMLNDWRCKEKRAGKSAPYLEPIGLTKGNHVVIHALPMHQQTVAADVLYPPLERHAVATFGCPKSRRRLRDRSFKGIGTRRVDSDRGNFSNHKPIMSNKGE